MTVSIKFETRKDGKCHAATVHGFYFSAYTKAELAEKIHEFIAERIVSPNVSLVRDDDEIMVTVFQGDFYEIYRPRGEARNGHVVMSSTTSGYLGENETAMNQVDRQLMHLAQMGWGEHRSHEPPEWLPERLRRDWDCWVRFQVAYKAAKDAGFDSGQCHQLACEKMHEPNECVVA